MPVENYVKENTPSAKDIGNWVRFSRHVLNVDNLWSNIARCSTSHEQIFRLIGQSCESEINDNWLLAYDDIVWL